MIKTGILETISFKHNRAKFNNIWINYDPFINTDDLQFGKEYEADVQLENQQWFIKDLKIKETK